MKHTQNDKLYYKDGVQVPKPNVIVQDNVLYQSPSDEMLKELGYEIKQIDYTLVENKDIQELRASAYSIESDKHLLSYIAYKELGQIEKANRVKELWLESRATIERTYPYVTNDFN